MKIQQHTVDLTSSVVDSVTGVLLNKPIRGDIAQLPTLRLQCYIFGGFLCCRTVLGTPDRRMVLGGAV